MYPNYVAKFHSKLITQHSHQINIVFVVNFQKAVDKDIGQVEHKLGIDERPKTGQRAASSRPGTRGRTARGKRAKTATEKEAQPPPTRAGRKKNAAAPKVVSEVGCPNMYYFITLRLRQLRLFHVNFCCRLDTVSSRSYLGE